MDLPDGVRSSGAWFRIIDSPPNEEVDWLSPITSKYTLCATKSGKVVCWDISSNSQLSSWEPEEKWELWKCRVEFDERMVYFTMARITNDEEEDDRLMEFILMGLHFPADDRPPEFMQIARFSTMGLVINVFLLDPSARILAAFVYNLDTETICLYLIPDWEKREYVLINTGIACPPSSNWSCIIDGGDVVIHCEESARAIQYFYPVRLLKSYMQQMSSDATVIPAVSARLSPVKILEKQFLSPPCLYRVSPASALEETQERVEEDSDPYPAAHWYPESAHFVRQWWPTVPGIPRMSCTVVLLAHHEVDTQCDKYVLAQHYFRVPIRGAQPTDGTVQNHALLRRDDSVIRPAATLALATPPATPTTSEADIPDDELLRLTYVTDPFRIVCIPDASDIGDDDEADRPRPLCAVDFGHAVWIEYVVEEDAGGGSQSLSKRMRFVTFPPPRLIDGMPVRTPDVPCQVHTLQTPPELDLDTVETVNIDQAQGAVIASVKQGQIFILCYS